jgi:hypothetical protein
MKHVPVGLGNPDHFRHSLSAPGAALAALLVLLVSVGLAFYLAYVAGFFLLSWVSSL